MLIQTDGEKEKFAKVTQSRTDAVKLDAISFSTADFDALRQMKCSVSQRLVEKHFCIGFLGMNCARIESILMSKCEENGDWNGLSEP
jgi:hypothetical protein